MKILGIETSCDETAAAVVEDGARVLSNVVASSASLHVETGGIIPEQAARQQIVSLIPVIDTAMAQAKCQKTDIDSLAVTIGPGLVGSLLVGVETAKTLAYLWKKPIVPVNHLLAHIYANWLSPHPPPRFPALVLVVSGGHTDMVLMKDHGCLWWIGGTRDDAAGEAFDKTARLLGLPYPGGPAIAAKAEKCRIASNKLQIFPRPMISKNNFDFSFSGLKTAVKNTIDNSESTTKDERLAAEVQEAIVDVLVTKTIKAVKKYQPRSLLLAGGVAANLRLRQKFKSEMKNLTPKVKFFVPEPRLCTDNAAYIAGCAYFNHSPIAWKKIEANPQLTIAGQI